MDAFQEHCFTCVLRATQRDLLDARDDGTMNQEFASRALRRLKSVRRNIPSYGSLNLVTPDCEVHYIQNHVIVAEELWKFVDVFMASLDISNFRQTALAAELLRFAYYFTENFRTIVRVCRLASRTLISDHQMLSDIEFQQLLKADYSVQHPVRLDDRIACDDKQHIVWFAVKDRREMVLPYLLRYGIGLFPTTHYNRIDLYEFDAALRCLNGHSLRNFIQFMQNDFMDSFRRRLGWPLHRVITVLRIMQLLSFELCERWDPAWEGPTGRKRPRLERNGESSTSGSVYFRCLQRAFETIPEPFVTSGELRRVFQIACGDMDETTEARIDDAMAMFESLYPDGAGPLAPRTLQHLSRCQVRQNLRQTGALPHGVRHLVLPNKIRKYIVLEE